jgi:hypothetical protein
MSEGRVDAITRSAAGALSRRSSLRTLGAAALAAGLAKVAGIEAKQNPVKKVKEKNKRRCGQVREACRAIPLAVPHPDDVSGLVLTCCEHCFVGDFLECFTAGLNAASVDDTLPHGLSQASA